MATFTIFFLASGDWKTQNSLDFLFIFKFHFLAKFCQKRGCLGHIWNGKSNGIMLSWSPIWKENILLHLVEVGN
jgi:hypothetical protein